MQLFTSPPISSRSGQIVIREDKPQYLVGDEKFFSGNRLYEKGSPITLEGEPNPHMIPLNRLAFERMKAYHEKLDKLGQKWALKNEKYYVPQVTAFVNKYGHLAATKGGVVNLGEATPVPILAGKQQMDTQAALVPFNTTAFVESIEIEATAA